MVGGFNDVEEAVSVSAATSEAKQKGSVSMSFQVQPCGDETAGANVVGQDIALACLEASPTGSQSSRAKRITGCRVTLVVVAGLQGVSPWRPATFTSCGFTRIVRLFHAELEARASTGKWHARTDPPF